MKPAQERLTELEAQQARLTARIQKERARMKVQERKRDTRRKILAGAVALTLADTNDAFRQALREALGDSLTRPDDRDLFDLPPKDPAPA